MPTDFEQITEDEKTRIRQEEIYRQEVRSSLEKKTSGGKLWSVLNSNFVLLILSSVVLTIAGWLYKNWSESLEVKRGMQSQINKLSVEMETRSDGFNSGLAKLYDKVHLEFPKSKHDALGPQFVDQLRELFNEYDHTATPVYPEFKNRGLLSLLQESIEIAETGVLPHPRHRNWSDLGGDWREGKHRYSRYTRSDFEKAQKRYKLTRQLVAEAYTDRQPPASVFAKKMHGIIMNIYQDEIGEVMMPPLPLHPSKHP